MSSTGHTDGSPSPDPIFEIHQEVYISDPHIKIKGVDCIWHNMYIKSSFTTFRKWYDDADADEMLLLVADHVRRGLYRIISMNVTKHMVVVVVACEKNEEELGDWFTMVKDRVSEG